MTVQYIFDYLIVRHITVMELRHLVLLHRGGWWRLSRAAERLRISPTLPGQQIRGLEDEPEVKLFERTKWQAHQLKQAGSF